MKDLDKNMYYLYWSLPCPVTNCKTQRPFNHPVTKVIVQFQV